MKNALIASLIAGIGMLLLACSGADIIPPTPNPPLPGPPQGGGPILNLTDEQRIAVLNECGAAADALGDLKSDAAQQTLVTYLKSRGEFEDAGAMNGNVWAYFHDGRLAMFIPDWLDTYAEIGGRVPTPDLSGGRQNAESLRHGVPEGKKVMLFHGLGSAYQDNRPYLTDIFSRSHTQYRTGVVSKMATVENLKSAVTVDVFYINTHGGMARPLTPAPAGSVFGLWTSDSLSIEREIRYKQDIDSKVLAYMYALEDRTGSTRTYEWHYAITAKFVFEHMSFTENSMMYIDACNGMNGDAVDFKDIMLGKATKESATYIGWTDPSDQATGFPTSRFVFDRLLGSPVFMPETPGQRPFDLDPIFDEFPKYNLGVSGYGGELEFESTVGKEIILAPSIKYITIDDYNSVMTIEGLFGDHSQSDRKVTVGGLTVHISSWTPNRIICELPVTGPGSSGDVIVIVNGHESNKVPLSEWTIPLHLVKDDFGVKVDAQLKLKIRADVHMYRSKPEETPKTDRPEMPTPPPGSIGFNFSAASSGTYSVSGQRLASCSLNGCTVKDTESSVSQHGALPFTFTSPGLGYSAYYEWSKDMKKITVTVIVNIPNVGMEMETYTFCGTGDPARTSHSVSTTLAVATTKPLEFHLDANYEIQKGDIDETKNMPWGRCAAPGYFKYSATWLKVKPEHGPKPDTEARYATGE